jgi:hypothetical protein
MRRLASILAITSLLVLAAAPAVLAAKPVVIDLPGIEYDDPLVCGGDPLVHVAYGGTFRLVLFFDQAGNLVRDAIEGGGPITVTFSADGSDRTLTGMSPAPFRTTYNADGSIATLTANGLNAAITIPGEGVVLLDTGSIMWAGGFGGPVEASGGPHDWFLGAETTAFCDYLAG